MPNKTVIATGVGVAVLLGGGAAAVAATNTPAPQSGSASTSTSTHKHAHRHERFSGEYAQWTTYNATTKTKVTHDGVRGTVSTVSATSISITAKDGTTKTYLLTHATKVHGKGDTKTHPGSISQVKVGDRAEVIGTGTSTLTATRVHDRGVVTTK